MFFQKLKKEYIKTIENLINEMYNDYDIYERESKRYINKNELLNKILFKINSDFSDNKINKKICSGIYKNGNRCNKNVADDNIYCKKHLEEIEMENQKIEQEYKYEQYEGQRQEQQQDENEENEIYNNKVINKLQSKFINDSFYYIDDHFIYDKEDYQKIGYIDNTNNDSPKFIFTQDPFLLKLF